MQAAALKFISGVLLLALAVPAAAGEGRPSLSYHEGARVTLLLDKKEYFLGENILLHYCVENTSQTPFQIQSGLDMNSVTRRQMSFEVIAKGEDGKPVEDPYHVEFSAGYGMGSFPVLKPGDKHYKSIQLVHFCRFEKPGVYTIRVVHDLGWRLTSDQQFPAGEIKIKLAMPTPKEARQVVEDMYKLPKDPNTSTGERHPPYADFAALRHPVYLPILLQRAQRADKDALEAIDEIPTPEATKALLGLLDHKERAFAVEAGERLLRRLPYPKESPYRDVCEAEHQWLLPRAWRAELASEVMAHARKLLASRRGDAMTVAARMVQSLGGKDDLPSLIAALDYAVPESEGLWRDEPYPMVAGPCPNLSEAADILAMRGAEIPHDPKSPGQKVVFLAAIRSKDAFQPKGWEAIVAALLQDKILYVRQSAILSLPRPWSKPFLGMLPAMLADPSVVIRIAACTVAAETKASELRQPILHILASSENKHLLRLARDAAIAQGSRAEALETLAARMANTDTGWECFQLVAYLVIEAPGYGTAYGIDSDEIKRFEAKTAEGTRARWMEFLRRHREAIQAGRRFKPGDPELAPDLIPPQVKITLRDGKQWP